MKNHFLVFVIFLMLNGCCVKKRTVVLPSQRSPIINTNNKCYNIQFEYKYLYEYPIEQNFPIDNGNSYNINEFYEIYANIPNYVPFNIISFNLSQTGAQNYLVDNGDFGISIIGTDYSTGRFTYQLGSPANYLGLFEWENQIINTAGEYVFSSNMIQANEVGLLTSHYPPLPITNGMQKIGIMVIKKHNSAILPFNLNINFLRGSWKGTIPVGNCHMNFNIGNTSKYFPQMQAFYLPTLKIFATFRNDILEIDTKSNDNWVKLNSTPYSPSPNYYTPSLFFDETSTDFNLVISKLSPGDLGIVNGLDAFVGNKNKYYNNIPNPIYSLPNTTPQSEISIQTSCKPFKRTHVKNNGLLPNTWYAVFLYYNTINQHRFSNISVFKTN